MRSKKYPNLLAVSRGSNDNLDYAAAEISTGRATVRVFDWTAAPSGGWDYLQGRNLAYGARNEVSVPTSSQAKVRIQISALTRSESKKIGRETYGEWKTGI